MSVGAVSTASASALYAEVIGQETAVSQLMVAAPRPVHAYLFVGASGNGAMTAAMAFAAALLCPENGCGACQVCAGARVGRHPDLHIVRRSGAQISVEDARRVVTLAQRRPLQADRQVVIVSDAHLTERAAPALLKTLEEPPGDTVFILLADHLNPDLTTIASRCVVIDFPPVDHRVVASWLRERGVGTELAAVIADSSGGSPERARLMIEDSEVANRAALWASVPERLDGSGAAVSVLVRQLIDSTDRAAEPLRTAHEEELDRLTAEAKEMGERSLPGRKELLDQYQREERRWRTDALRAGLGALARVYRARAGGTGTQAGAAARAVDLLTETAQALPRNPNETVLLHALLLRLGSLSN